MHFSQRAYLLIMLTTVLAVAGIWSALRLPSAIYPELTFPRITIVAQGASLGARQVVFGLERDCRSTGVYMGIVCAVSDRR